MLEIKHKLFFWRGEGEREGEYEGLAQMCFGKKRGKAKKKKQINKAKGRIERKKEKTDRLTNSIEKDKLLKSTIYCQKNIIE